MTSQYIFAQTCTFKPTPDVRNRKYNTVFGSKFSGNCISFEDICKSDEQFSSLDKARVNGVEKVVVTHSYPNHKDCVIDVLPIEILIHILSFVYYVDVSSFLCTCKKYSSMSWKSSLWKSLFSARVTSNIANTYIFDYRVVYKTYGDGYIDILSNKIESPYIIYEAFLSCICNRVFRVPKLCVDDQGRSIIVNSTREMYSHRLWNIPAYIASYISNLHEKIEQCKIKNKEDTSEEYQRRLGNRGITVDKTGAFRCYVGYRTIFDSICNLRSRVSLREIPVPDQIPDKKKLVFPVDIDIAKRENRENVIEKMTELFFDSLSRQKRGVKTFQYHLRFFTDRSVYMGFLRLELHIKAVSVFIKEYMRRLFNCVDANIYELNECGCLNDFLDHIRQYKYYTCYSVTGNRILKYRFIYKKHLRTIRRDIDYNITVRSLIK